MKRQRKGSLQFNKRYKETLSANIPPIVKTVNRPLSGTDVVFRTTFFFETVSSGKSVLLQV